MPRQNSSCLTLEAKISTARTKGSGLKGQPEFTPLETLK